MSDTAAIKASITLPRQMNDQLRRLAKQEQRTLSGLLQEAVRTYLRLRQWEEIQQEVALRAAQLGLRDEDDVTDMIHSWRRSRK